MGVSSDSGLTLTVAICTHNPDDALLARVLESIGPQVDGDRVIQVVIVDNNSMPPLADRRVLDGRDVELVEEPVPGLTAARMAAITAASGDVIVFVDDDNILDTEYLEVIRQEFVEDGSVGIVGGRILPEYEVPPPSWFGEFEGALAIRRWEGRTVTSGLPWTDDFPVGAGMAVRRDIATRHMSETAEGQTIQGRRGTALTSGEDLDLDLFALSHGWKLVATGRAGLTHVIPATRVTSGYLSRLARANVLSSYELDRKWAPVFGQAVFPQYETPLVLVLTRALVTRILGVVSSAMRVKAARQLALARLRLELVRTARRSQR